MSAFAGAGRSAAQVDEASLATAGDTRYLSGRLTQLFDSVFQKLLRANAGVDDRNVGINTDFRINQRSYVSGTALSSGAYAHDRHKAGAAGCTYTFTQLKSSTQINITAGSLIQIVEDCNIEGGTYVLSWTGTAPARVGVNSATPSGSYLLSPIVINGQTAGTVMSVEFGVGTLGKWKLEVGSVPTPYVMSRHSAELYDCMRYYETGGVLLDCAVNPTTTVRQIWITYVKPKRVAPTLTTSSPNGSPTVNGNSVVNFSAFSTATTTYMGFNWTASAEL